MKVMYLLDQCTNAGGVERVVSLKANYLVDKGYEVYIVSRTKEEERNNTFFYWDSRIKMIDIGTPNIKSKFKTQILHNLSKILEEIKPDIVISTGLKSLKYASSINDGSKKIIEYHFAQYKRDYWLAGLENNSIGRLILKLKFQKNFLSARKYDRIIVLTEEDKKSRLIHPFKRIDVIPNPISFEVTEPSPLTGKRIIAIGRIESQKAFHKLVQLWGKIEKNYPEWNLTIYGKGSKEGKIRELIKKLSLERVNIEPPTSQIKKEIMNSSILCMTSRNEGFGLVIIEAMGCGVPPVTFDFKCGPQDIIENGVNGFYSKRNDPEKFIHNLKLLMDNETLRKKMGRAAYEESHKYQLDQIMAKWITLFEEVIQEKANNNKVN